jgi:hypothetical protein
VVPWDLISQVPGRSAHPSGAGYLATSRTFKPEQNPYVQMNRGNPDFHRSFVTHNES